jgi:hypothetical protein
LAPPDFFLRKELRLCEKIRDLNHLKARTRERVEQVTRDMLQRVWQEVDIDCT